MKKPLKIAIYSGNIPSTTFIERLIEGLSNKSCEVYLFGFLKKKVTYSKKVSVFAYKNTRLHKAVFLLKYSMLLFLFKTKKKQQLDILLNSKSKNLLLDKVKCYPVLWHQPDIFHVQWAKGLDDWMWVQEFGMRLVLSLRGAHINYSPIADQALAATYRDCFPKLDGFHAVSKAIGLEAQKYGADPKLIHTVYSGLPIHMNIKLEKKSNSIFKIISVGRPHWIKGYTYALDACEFLKDVGFNFCYSIVGGEDTIEYQYQIRDLSLENNTQLLGQQDFDTVQTLIHEADLLLLPSLQEGIANVVLEAMSLGTLVLSTDCGGMHEVIQDGENGFLIPLRNPEHMARKILDIANISECKKQQIREKALQTIRENYSEIKMVDGMLALYESILKKNNI
ncbi:MULTISPECIES: glycosyltransferase family 4 protein [Flavobacteriaceae]|uniref:glycosyltransferase family 4 protein n=1 Tax=Flavobacteriaceae TaxID=49546 RepID=UPI003A9400EB